MPPAMDPIFVSVKDAAQALSLTPWTVYQLANNGHLESRYHGRRRLIVVESLRKYAAGLPDTAPEPEAS